MKKSYLRNLAVLGITGSVILATQQLNAANPVQGLSSSEQLECGCRGGYIRNSSNQKTNPNTYGYGRKQNNRGFVAMNDSSNDEMDGSSDDEDYSDDGMSNPQYYPQRRPGSDSTTRPMDNMRGTNPSDSNYNPTKKPTAYQYSPRTIATADEAPAKSMDMESEDQLLKQLDAEGKRIYNSLTPEGKQLAQRLAKQYADKNQAVKHAQKQMSGMSGNAAPVKGMDNKANY